MTLETNFYMFLMTKKYFILVWGCQMNSADAEKVEAILSQLGYRKTAEEKSADLIVAVACSIRQSAINRLYGQACNWQKRRKQGRLLTILTGCVLPKDKNKLAKIFDLVLEVKDINLIPQELTKLKILNIKDYFHINPRRQSNFQAYVPIMTGCNNFCSYCVVPYVRGQEVSRPSQEVIAECKKLISQGFKEIILLGQNVNSYYGGKIGFPKLLKTIDELPGIFWLSFMTSHPKDLSDELIKVMAGSKHIIPYLHLPVQSGDNQILKKMNRHYTVAHYKNLIKKVRKAIPRIAISTDVIVGFPGETKKQFANTARLFKEIKFDMAYLAQYSVRPGTAAARLEDNVPKVEKKRREKVLNQVLEKVALKNNQKLIGQTVEVLVDDYKDGQCFGRTSGFKNIKFASAIVRTGEIVLVKVIDCYAWGLVGELPKVIIILGTTSSGKTKLAVKLAKKFNGEIISADSRQVYRGMDIGTGKDLAEYGKVSCHLIDVISPKDQFTVADWQKMAYEKIQDILKRGKLPIVCGGTGLYISALVEGYNLSEIRYQKSDIRNKLNKLSLKQLLVRLKKIDPKTYQVIDKKNRRRVQRALEIYCETGQPKSAQLSKNLPPYEFLQIGVTFPKAILKKRIKQRLKHRLEKEGMINEIKRLNRQGVSWSRLEEFGLEYRFISRYLQGKISYQEMVEQLNRAINDFAKRQMTWFKKDKRIRWVKDLNEVKNQVNKFIK